MPRFSKPMVWAIFTYQCEKCGEEIKVQLAVGVEGPRDGLVDWVPSPFCIGCKGEKRCTDNYEQDKELPPVMYHVRWNEDIIFDPKPAEPGWVFVPDHNCAKLVLVEE